MDMLKYYYKMQTLNKSYTNKEWLYERYVTEKLSMTKIGKLCNCSCGIIGQWLSKFNIPFRDKATAWKIRKNNKEIVTEEGRKKRRKRMLGNKIAYKGGRVPHYKNTSQWRINRLIAMKKFNWKCQACGKRADICHHIDLSTDNHAVENLLPMCYSCHFKLHHEIYRRQRLQIEQLSLSY